MGNPDNSKSCESWPGSPERGGKERRRHPRYDFSVPAFVRVLVEEETFNPYRFAARTCNISIGGMMLEIEGMSEDLYKTLIRRQRSARVHLNIPGVQGEVTLFGKIVWYDFRQTAKEATCRTGIAFEQLPEKEQKILNDLIARLEKESSQPTEEKDKAQSE